MNGFTDKDAILCKYFDLFVTKISALPDQPFSFPPKKSHIWCKNHYFLSQVKILVVLHQVQKEWIRFYLK